MVYNYLTFRFSLVIFSKSCYYILILTIILLVIVFTSTSGQCVWRSQPHLHPSSSITNGGRRSCSKCLSLSVQKFLFTKHEITSSSHLVVHTSFIFIYLMVADDFHLLAILMNSCYINMCWWFQLTCYNYQFRSPSIFLPICLFHDLCCADPSFVLTHLCLIDVMRLLVHRVKCQNILKISKQKK